ncbi:MAG: response regulator transcription factor [Tannerella sp.]|jgi:two-component system response regulator NreC|nr:response regulator transcription factor [Tannerella sp.]
MIKVIIIDDQGMFRFGVRMAIETRHPDLQIVGEAETGAELFALLNNEAPDILLLDIDLPDMSGIDIARRLKQERPEIKILAFSAQNSAETVQAMVDIGIEGFISKRHGGVDIFAEAVRAVVQGDEYFGQDISKIIYRIYVAKKNTAEVTSDLTEQEKRVIELCQTGLPGKLIADSLNISIKTLHNHKSNIFRKLGINSTGEMVNYALKKGIIRVE